MSELPEIQALQQRCFDLIKGIDSEWSTYLGALIQNTKDERELIIGQPRAMVYQLRNPAVVIKEEDDSETYASGCVWLLNYVDGTREIVVPEETSGVLFERATGKLIKNFTGLPTPLPDNVNSVIRIAIRTGIDTNDVSINWRLFSTDVSKFS